MVVEKILPYLFPALIWAMTLVITLRLLFKKQSVTAMLSWLMMIYIVPVVGIVAYLIFGEVNLGKKRTHAFNRIKPRFIKWYAEFAKNPLFAISNTPSKFQGLLNLVQDRLTIPCVIGNELHVLHTPKSVIEQIVADIEQAKENINMVFYIWQSGGLVDKVEQALTNAVKRGVSVKIMLDSVGSRPFLKGEEMQKMQASGIEIVECLHVSLFRLFFSRIDLRMHRKIIAIDNHISYTGSMNMVDPKYFKQDANVGEWVDMMVRIVGPVSSILNSLHAVDWQVETGEMLPLTMPTLASLPEDPDNSHAVQILATGPGFPEDLMEQSLAQAIFSATKSIVITSPYFVPSHKIAEALQIASYRGVEVSLILPAKNDSTMVAWASRTFFDDLLSAGVKIYQFEKGLLHTKSILIDDRLAMVGTVNMDMRSFLLNFEVMMLVEDKSFAYEVHLLQEQYKAHSEIMSYKIWETRPSYYRIIAKLFFFFSPLL